MTTYQPPYAAVLCSVAGGTPTSGGQVVGSTSQSLQFSAVSTGNWSTGLWEIYDYPPGYTVPTGWTLNAISGAIYYNGTSAAPNPPSVTLQFWGKLAVRLTVNSGYDPTGAYNPGRMIDASCALSMLSPNSLRDLFYGEGPVFGGFRNWTGDHKANLRVIDALLTGISGAPTPQRLTSGGAIVAHTIWQPVSIDTTSNTVVAAMPTGIADGQVVEVSDVTGQWSVHQAGVSVTSAAHIEDPTNPGTYITNGTLTLPADKSASYSWRWWATETRWKLL